MVAIWGLPSRASPGFRDSASAWRSWCHVLAIMGALLTHAMSRAGFWGGSADLAPSNMTLMKQFGDFQKDTPQERNLRFGVREHGMGAIANGIALHSPGFIPYCATFFIFTGTLLTAPPSCSGLGLLNPCYNVDISKWQTRPAGDRFACTRPVSAI